MSFFEPDYRYDPSYFNTLQNIAKSKVPGGLTGLLDHKKEAATPYPTALSCYVQSYIDCIYCDIERC